MHGDEIFRLIIGLGLAFVTPVGLYHRIRSQATREPLDRWQEGLFILLTLRPFGLVAIFGVLAFVVNPGLMAWSSVPFPIELRWTGSGIGVLAAGLAVWTFRTLGVNITDTVVTRKNHTLVTNGPYRYLRHPFYVATTLFVVAGMLATANWFIAITGTVTLTLLIIRTSKEEELLVKRFGDDYRHYMNRTGRFIPRVGKRV